jgi:hypothetical protein
MESILTSIKKLLGLTEEYTHFDVDITMHINSVFKILKRLGVGPAEGFRIEGASTTWSEFIPEDENLEDVKSYMYMKVKLLFDPPDSSAHMTAMKEAIAEFEFQLHLEADSDEQ